MCKKMLAEIVGGHIHDVNGIQSTAASPRRSPMGCLPGKGEDDRVKGVPTNSIACTKSTAAVVIDYSIHIIEKSGPDHVGPADQGLLCRRTKNLDRSLESMFDHGFLDSDRRCRRSRAHSVMPTAMAWGSLHERILSGDSPLLRDHGQSIIFSKDTDHRLSRAIAGDKTCGHSRRSPLDRESRLLQCIGQELLVGIC